MADEVMNRSCVSAQRSPRVVHKFGN